MPIDTVDELEKAQMVFEVLPAIGFCRPTGLRGDRVRAECLAELEHAAGALRSHRLEVCVVLSLEEREVSRHEGFGGPRQGDRVYAKCVPRAPILAPMRPCVA